jgi:hypothetical protein
MRATVPSACASARSAYFKRFLFNICVAVVAVNVRAWRVDGRCRRGVVTVQAAPWMARM